jgi:cytochrome c556
MPRHSPKLRWVVAVAVGALACAMLSQAAFADQSCGDDIQKLSQRRDAEMAKINKIVQAGKGKKLDPAQFCSQSAGLNAAENAFIAYMVKNKDWCSIPDEIVANLKDIHAKNASFSAKACAVAAQVRKMKEQQASGSGPHVQPLPAGPL